MATFELMIIPSEDGAEGAAIGVRGLKGWVVEANDRGCR